MNVNVLELLGAKEIELTQHRMLVQQLQQENEALTKKVAELEQPAEEESTE